MLCACMNIDFPCFMFLLLQNIWPEKFPLLSSVTQTVPSLTHQTNGCFNPAIVEEISETQKIEKLENECDSLLPVSPNSRFANFWVFISKKNSSSAYSKLVFTFSHNILDSAPMKIC